MTSHTGPFDGAREPGRRTPEGTSPEDDDVVEGEIVDAVVDEADAVIGAELDELAAARRERDEYLGALQRLQADFENYKKRMLRQQTEHLERAAEDLVSKVLPVLDAFDLARAHLGDGAELSPEGKALVAGSTLLADTLAREGLERIDNPGAPFDPTTHEAVEHTDAGATTDDGAPSGPVVDAVLRAGYRWKGRVIRPAMVRVRG
jgi:molecular chaperone GrpE